MHDLVLTPHTVVARWANATLVVHAAGQEGGITEVCINRCSDSDGRPAFQVTARMAPFAGLFPYGVTSVFELSERPQEVVVHTSTGTERVPVL